MSYVSFVRRIGALILALSFVCGGATAQQVEQVDKGVWKTPDQKASLAMGKLNRIIIRAAESVGGSIEIESGYVKEAQLVYSKTAKVESRTGAMDFVDALSVSLDAFGGQARLEFRAPNPPPWNQTGEAGIVTSKLVVPRGTFVQIEASSFDVKARGPLSGLVVVSSLGQIDASLIDSVLDVTTANQKIVLHGISGDISASTSNAPLQVTLITAKGAPARFKNEGGEIKIDSLVGAVNARNNFGRISISNFSVRGEASTIKGTSGPIEIGIADMKSGQLVVSNKLEDIEITIPPDLSAFMALSVEEDGKIEATGFKFRTDLVQRNRLNLVTGKGDVNISCGVKGKGNIYVRGGSSE